MPFEQYLPHPFSFGPINQFAPAQSGVYGISNAREWLYVGQAENIRGALLAHLHETATMLMKQAPTGFVFEVCDGIRRPDREARLVNEYRPLCNRKNERG